MKITVVKSQMHGYKERKLELLGFLKGQAVHVYPVQMIREACGSELAQDGHFTSFADGLAKAGNEVWLVGGSKRKLLRPYVGDHVVFPIYSFLGHMFALGKWEGVVRALAHVQRGSRMLVLEHTAYYYFDRMYETSFSLRIEI